MLQLEDGEINEYQLRMTNQWSVNDIMTFKPLYEKKFAQNPKEAKECLNTIYEYRLSFQEGRDLNLTNIHKKGINKFFSDTKKNRTIEELIPNHNELVIEMKLDNYDNSKDREIIKRINNIKSLCGDYMNKGITKENLTENLKSSEDDLIAIVMSNLKKVANITLRDSQLYSLIILLGKNNDKGRIIQVFSGEGKTLIIQCLAAVLALQGHKVDIICAEKSIVKKDSKAAMKNLENLKITVAHNLKIENDCYKKDILYGTIVEFQGGIMRDGHQLNGERQNRGFDIVLLDEIECMFIDDFTQSTNLVSNKPFYERYSIYLLILWGYYKNLHLNNFDVRDNKELQEKVKQYLNDKLKNFIKINDDKSDFFFPMSNLLKDFAIDQSQNWVTSLINSLSQRKNIEYAVKNDQILKVDLIDTGLISKEKTFENGLQQFLQIQNELSVTPISTKTSQNNLSNYGFFQKYKNEKRNSIYGVTGAFGSVKSRELIEKLYSLDFDYIPTNNLFLLKELTSNISKNHDTWIENILLVVKREINSGRLVLLLCETVGSCEELYEKISLNFPKYKLFKIIGDEGEKNIIPQTVGKNTVIISTDMSGRGSKFDIDKEVLKNGGMHIIFSFISNNSRKEEKNYKNAGKAGEPGSYQFILDFEDTMNKYYINYNIEANFEKYKSLLNKKEKTGDDYKAINNYSIENIKNLREERVDQRCNNALEKIPNTEKSDYLFNIYCDMVEERKDLKETENKYNLNSIDEQWGMFLKKMDVDSQTLDQVKSKCKEFKNKIFGDLNKGTVIKNPGYYNQYVNEKLASLFFYLRNKNIIAEINKQNFEKAKTYFVEKPEEVFDYDGYIQKCKAAIELDNYSFIPYYLNGVCKLISGKGKGIEDLEQALFHINNEIQRYLYYFGLLISLNINIDLLFYQINILNSIKINVIQRDIDNYYANTETNPEYKLYRKLSKDCFLYQVDKLEDEDDFDEEEGNIEEDKDKKLLKSIKQYYLNTETNGLKYLFFLRDSNSFSFESLISTGIIMIGLSISGISFLDNILNEEVFKDVGNKLGIDLNRKDYEEWIKKKHESDFPFSKDKNLNDFIQNNNIKIKNTNKDLLEIMKKYDKDYQSKINKEFGKTFKTLLRKKIEKLNLENYKDFIWNKDQEDDEKCIECALKNIKDLDEKKKKIILANNLVRRGGRDWLTDETREGKDINERIENAQKDLGTALDEIIFRELQISMNKEIEKNRALRDEQNEKLNKQKEVLAEKKNIYDKLSEAYKSRQKAFVERRDKKNKGFDELNKKIDEYNQDNSKHDLQQLNKEGDILKKEQEDLNKEVEELNKDFQNLEKERESYNKENTYHNEIVKESNKFNDLANERVKLHNNLKDFITVDFSQDELKIKFNNANNSELTLFENELKQLEVDSNLAYKDELKRIGLKIITKEKEKIILEKRNEFEQVLLKVIKEKNNFWNNCFNQAFSAVNHAFNTDDMKKIINNHIDEKGKNNRNKNEYYYLKTMESDKSIKRAERKLNEENKIIVGNVCNDNNAWNSYCIVPHNNSKYFLYKSNDGSKPSKDLVNKIQQLTGGYVPKINNSNSGSETDFSEVNAIENDKIMIDQIEEDKEKFVDNFEYFSKFYNESRENKLNKKQQSYPKEYIKGLYNEIARRNNTKRISVVLFDKYFLNENKDNEIDLEFLKKLNDILLNFDDISNEEKQILTKEYNDIIDVYNNVYHLIKQKEEEEQKEIEQIIKNKYKRSIKNVKHDKNEENQNQNEIKPKQVNPERNDNRQNPNEIQTQRNGLIPNRSENKQRENGNKDKNDIIPNPNGNREEQKERGPKQNNIKPKQNEINPEENENKKIPRNNDEKRSSNKNNEDLKENKENINNNQIESPNFENSFKKEPLNLNSRNKSNIENTERGDGGVNVYDENDGKDKTKLIMLNDDPDSKRGLSDNNNDENMRNNNDNIYNRNVKSSVQGPEVKDNKKDSKGNNNGNGNNGESKCCKDGCLLF